MDDDQDFDLRAVLEDVLEKLANVPAEAFAEENDDEDD